MSQCDLLSLRATKIICHTQQKLETASFRVSKLFFVCQAISVGLKLNRPRCNIGYYNIRAWLIEIQQSDWLATVIFNSVYCTVEYHALKTIDNGLKRDLLSFRNAEML